MNPYFVAAAILAVVVGLVHSVLGEIMIFRGMRQDGLVPTNGGTVLRESNVRILWASWHLVTVLGFCIAAILIWLAMPISQAPSSISLQHSIIAAMTLGSALVAVGTNARHPGWVGLLGVAILVWIG